jgi:hypothetical protein
VYARPQPDPVLLEELEDFLVSTRVLVPDDYELLFVRYELRDVFPKQRKRRIGDDDIRLLD